MKTIQNKALISLLIIVSAGSFFAGVVFKHYRIYQNIPLANYFLGSKKQSSKSQFLYRAPRQGISEIFSKKDVQYPFTFIVYGDSREPTGNEKEALITRIIRERPSFVIHTGDMVRHGDEHQWKIFDLFDGRIIQSGIPMFPALGNHEYYTKEKKFPDDPHKPLELYFSRFKSLAYKRWYSFTYGNSRFLILDTNTNYLPGSNQYAWLMNELAKEDPGFLFIATHHPLHTKAHYYSRSSEAKLADILESYPANGLVKTDIVFSGHVHSYERYQYSNIWYITSGGGGAPQHSINRDSKDFFRETGEVFHYCKIMVSRNNVTFEMVQLNMSTGKWKIADRFNINFN